MLDFICPRPYFSHLAERYEELVVPIYEYQCNACNHKFEILQKVSDGLLTECPACKQNALRKLVTAAAFRLKGGGWYETDFKDKKAQKNAGADAGDDKSGGNKDATAAKSDSGKPESVAASEKASTTKPVSTSDSKES